MDKVSPLTDRSRLLGAGDILNDRPLWSAARLAASRGEPLAEIVRIYQAEYIAQRNRLSELRFLIPHGLSLETWVQHQHTMNPALVMGIARELTQENLLDVDTIICGFDEHARDPLGLPHLYRIEDFGQVTIHDTEGIVAVGIGADVVYAEFQAAGYVRTWDRHSTLRLLYAAKKKAEKIEGVGRKTDIFEIKQTNCYNRGPDWVDRLDAVHASTASAEDKIRIQAERKVRSVLRRRLPHRKG